MDSNLWHFDMLSQWQTEYYKEVFLPIHLTGDEIAVGDEENRSFFFIAKKDDQLYLIPSEIIENGEMPFKVLDMNKVGHKGKAYWKITRIKSVRIREEQTMTYKKMINEWVDYKHKEKDRLILHKIITDTYFCSRINVRIVSYPGWMKDSTQLTLSLLRGGCVAVNKPTLAKLKYLLNNSLKGLALNEIQKLDDKERNDLAKFYEDTGDFKPFYVNPSRSAAGAAEMCNITNLSTLTFFNFPDSKKPFEEQKKEIFDNMFEPKIRQRIFPILFVGGDEKNPACEQRFGHVTEKITQPQIDEITNWMRNHIFYEAHGKELAAQKHFQNKYYMQNTRWDRNFQAICERIKLYSESQEEFDYWTKLLYICNKHYEEWLTTGQVPSSENSPRQITIEEKPVAKEEVIEEDNPTKILNYIRKNKGAKIDELDKLGIPDIDSMLKNMMSVGDICEIEGKYIILE